MGPRPVGPAAGDAAGRGDRRAHQPAAADAAAHPRRSLTDEEIHGRIIDLHIVVLAASRHRHRMYATGAPWDAVREARAAESRAVNERDRFLAAAVAHRESWCHDLTDCPICQG